MCLDCYNPVFLQKFLYLFTCSEVVLGRIVKPDVLKHAKDLTKVNITNNNNLLDYNKIDSRVSKNLSARNVQV